MAKKRKAHNPFYNMVSGIITERETSTDRRTKIKTHMLYLKKPQGMNYKKISFKGSSLELLKNNLQKALDYYKIKGKVRITNKGILVDADGVVIIPETWQTKAGQIMPVTSEHQVKHLVIARDDKKTEAATIFQMLKFLRKR